MLSEAEMGNDRNKLCKDLVIFFCPGCKQMLQFVSWTVFVTFVKNIDEDYFGNTGSETECHHFLFIFFAFRTKEQKQTAQPKAEVTNCAVDDKRDSEE